MDMQALCAIGRQQVKKESPEKQTKKVFSYASH